MKEGREGVWKEEEKERKERETKSSIGEPSSFTPFNWDLQCVHQSGEISPRRATVPASLGYTKATFTLGLSHLAC